MRYRRSSPSPRYSELLSLYRTMHVEGDASNGLAPDMTFNGISLRPHVNRIRNLIQRFEAESILDYGCGKAFGYRGPTVERADKSGTITLQEFWGLREIGLFDPAVDEFSTLPERRFDAVVSTDVLEHCPEEDIGWILGEIFLRARKFVYCTVALYPAAKQLPDGSNAHVTLKDAAWWRERFAEAAESFPHLSYFLVVMPSPTEMTEIEVSV